MGAWSLSSPPNARRIATLLRNEARRCRVRLLGVENGGDRLVLRLSVGRRDRLAEYLRVVGGRIPRLVTGAERNRALKPGRAVFRAAGGRKFWDGLVATRKAERISEE